MMDAVRITVSGRVQGVGFRYSTQQKASSLKLSGWVRNERDGSVSLHVEGDPIKIDAFERWLKVGPPGATVADLKRRVVPAQKLDRGFKIEF